MTGPSDEGGIAVAIVGMAALFPGAPDLTTYWRNLARGVDAIGEVPEGRWDPVFYQAGSHRADRFYCRRGGFVDGLASFDPLSFGLMPVSVDGTEPDQLVALGVAAAALEDAGGAGAIRAPERSAVIVGRGGYLGAGLGRLDQRVRGAEQVVSALRDLLPDVDEDVLSTIRAEFQDRIGPSRPDDAIGIVPNLVASRIANRFDLQGPAYTVDAACASSLVAVDHGARLLTGRTCDLVVAGGVHHCHDLTLWSVFSQLGAISPQGRIRPFHREADGLLIGEGTGMVVLKRLEDAERDGDRVYAVVRGVGVASDGRGSTLMAPSPAGQVLSLRRAWDMAGLDPTTIGLLEAHGTATAAGDGAELASAAQVFGRPDAGEQRVPIGSVKSMIGHAMPAAGMAGLIKAALAVHHRVLPPTLHCEDPHPGLTATRFRVLDRSEPWTAGETPRRAAISAFGFGGINAHVVLEEHRAEARVRARARYGNGTVSSAGRGGERLILCAADDAGELLDQLDRQLDRPEAGVPPGVLGSPARLRLALVDADRKRVDFARQVVAAGTPWRGRLDVWFSPGRLLDGTGKVAFLFPGIEAVFDPQVDDVADAFGLPRLDPVDTTRLGRHGFGVLDLGRLLDRALRATGIRPDVVAGHSIGEGSGMVAAGMVPDDRADEHLASLDPDRLAVADLVFAAVGCAASEATRLTTGVEDISVSHDNCPHQSILCGTEAAVATALDRFRTAKVMAQQLPFRSGFHSPMFEPHLEPIRASLAGLALQAPRVPLWSATTCEPYPSEPDAIRALAARHLVEPVRFRELALRLHDHGVRAFVQVGTGSLVGFLDDTLPGREYLAVTAASRQNPGLAQLRRAAAA
ncbi:MAG: beta-ketoacyl synthase N-terminal-like domain-containing protein, partial [Acidimicrobiales bacterium]